MTNQLMYVLLQFTWGILQNLAGLVMFLVCKMLGCKSKKYKNAVATKWNNKYGSVSLGMFLFVTNDEDETLLAHEYGHSLQSIFLGPLFFFVIGIPSICWAAFGDGYRKKHNKTYYEFYTEKFANDLVGLDKYRRFIVKPEDNNTDAEKEANE